MQTKLECYAEAYLCTFIKITYPRNYFIALDFIFFFFYKENHFSLLSRIFLALDNNISNKN